HPPQAAPRLPREGLVLHPPPLQRHQGDDQPPGDLHRRWTGGGSVDGRPPLLPSLLSPVLPPAGRGERGISAPTVKIGAAFPISAIGSLPERGWSAGEKRRCRS